MMILDPNYIEIYDDNNIDDSITLRKSKIKEKNRKCEC